MCETFGAKKWKIYKKRRQNPNLLDFANIAHCAAGVLSYYSSEGAGCNRKCELIPSNTSLQPEGEARGLL